MAVSAALMLMLTLAACGGSSSTSQSSSTPASASQTTSAATAATGTQTSGATPSNAQAATTGDPKHAPKEAIRVSSPVLRPGSKIPARYTCDGAGTSPPLRWGTVPQGTVELELFVLDLKSEPTVKPVVNWAVTGLHPTLRGISAGKLPPGAIVGRNSSGQSRYTICPTRREGLQRYVVALLALPRSVSATPGFNASAFFKKVLHTAEYSGLVGFTYQRR
ncbi:MAG TPA: YbhB/YbcL family Raf kinase inhibitor-like protein [Solirubrobacteraceae bacterium]|nr:YbhB/YbcL family Raf kinase inhibitor-like protein [Solirubrobacteraceae bacterium]